MIERCYLTSSKPKDDVLLINLDKQNQIKNLLMSQYKIFFDTSENMKKHVKKDVKLMIITSILGFKRL